MQNNSVNFVSKTTIDERRQAEKEAREKILFKAEENYHKREEILKKKQERGEDKWLLPSVEERLKSKKSKKKKKEKKKKKKHKKKDEKSGSESASEGSEMEWVEIDKKEREDFTTTSVTKREDWMTLPPSLFPCVSREEINKRPSSKRTKERDEARKLLDNPGQTSRELNPYWKDGGSGLPDEKPEKREEKKNIVGDGGLSWLKRAYKRVLEQAKEQDKTPEEVAAERWGSLEKLKGLMREAEERLASNKKNLYDSKRDQKRYSSFSRYNERSEKLSKERNFVKPDEDGSTFSKRVNPRYGISSSGWKKNDPSANIKNKTIDHQEQKNTSQNLTDESTSSDESENEVAEVVQEPAKVLSEKEMNALGARILKCEILGNHSKAAELKKELEIARKLKTESPASNDSSSQKLKIEDETVILTRTNSKGFSRPLAEPESNAMISRGRRQKKEKIDTHDGKGERVRYFADDDNYTLKEMFEREKLGTSEDHNAMLARLAGKISENQEDFDDILISKANRKQSESKIREIDRSRAIFEHKKKTSAMENCNFCFEGNRIKKHLIIAIGIKAYLCLPEKQSLVEGHCMICPMQHVPCSTQVDEDVWSEIQIFRKGLTKLFEDQNKVAIFFETIIKPKKYPHMVLECIPMDREIGDLAPIYFKKAIMESEKEWSQNKKLIELKGRDVRRAVPVGLPYFSVDFGLENGFAHVIEEELSFPPYFAQEIIGGMLDLEPRLWRKPPHQNFDIQRKKVLEFAEWWKPFDWTQRLQKDD